MEQELSGHWACSRWVKNAPWGYLQCFPSNTDQLNILQFLLLAWGGLRPHSAHLTIPAAVQQVLLCQIQTWVAKGATERLFYLLPPTSCGDVFLHGIP